jgi:hypothetical protein
MSEFGLDFTAEQLERAHGVLGSQVAEGEDAQRKNSALV